ncbi:MAG: MotA/TolQ/ExbB proton channel family protein [Gammaproteobacteria bacterium]|nr:MotA/TolQ/ExbB proton channel family protein [Gammaproteobacteria bacterium]MCY4218290.1 MotA/TolQ/ExbB proton channel family protein [Gammaproteobacteria bacterium]MCY4275858.1 MotA/TolQ/ExbB proton channel family protein [Gammaproteobacteria bacterium]
MNSPLTGLSVSLVTTTDMNRPNLLLLRFAVLNILALSLVIVGAMEGWIHRIIEADVTRISILIAVLFIIGWSICTYHIHRCTGEMKRLSASKSKSTEIYQIYFVALENTSADARMTISECLRSRLYSRISIVRLIANNLVIFGLIGTVIGFVIALSGVDANKVADAASIGPMITTLIQGMSVALYTTLVGAILHVWLIMCYQILAVGTVSLVNAIIEYTYLHPEQENVQNTSQ